MANNTTYLRFFIPDKMAIDVLFFNRRFILSGVPEQFMCP